MSSDSLLDEIIRDRVSGAQELTGKAGLLVLRLAEEKDLSALDELRSAVLEVGLTLLRAQPAMASLFNLFNRILHELDEAPNGSAGSRVIHRATQTFIREMEEHNQRISAHLFDLIEEDGAIITHSASRSVREALGHCWKKGKRFSIICTESRPACEGTLLARHLAEQGIPTSLTTDALSFSLLKSPPQGKKEHTLLLVGADSVSLHGVINKAGTLGLAVAAHSWSIPFYALAGSEKFLPSMFPIEKALQEKPSDEILSAPPEGLKIINRYFDITPLAHLTAVVSDKGTLQPQDLKAHLENLTPHPQLLAALNDSE